MNTYILVYLCSWLLAILITPVVIKLANRFNMVDSPDVRKVHSRPIPRIGGVAIFVPMMALIVPILFLNNAIGDRFRVIQSKVLALLVVATFIFFVGVIDDIRGLRARTKLLCQLAAAITMCIFDIRITSVAISDWFTIDFGWFSWPLTICWIVGITNAVNLIDGLDGLAAGIAAIACGVIVALSVCFHQPVMAVIMLSLLGSLTGFLFFNFNPAKIFMGDSGSLFIGFILASASVMCAVKSQAIVGLTLPVLALGIPIFDTLLSILRRFLERRSIFSPDRNHFHHRLLALGFRHRQAVIVAYAATLLITGLGTFMIFTRSVQSITIFACILLLLILAFRVVGLVKLKEVVESLQKKYAIASQMKQERESFDEVELHFGQARTFDQWWQSVCLAAERMHFAKSSMSITNRDGTIRILTWRKKNENAEANSTVKMVVPVSDRRSLSPLNLEIEVCANGSLESAGHRATLFARLIEKYSVANLPQRAKRCLNSQLQNCGVTV